MSPRSRTVLVVEDDPLLRTFYRSALGLAGYAVVTADDGIQALHAIDGYQPAAIVLDLGLPALQGRDVARELAAHELERDIPIIIVTGEDTRDLDHTAFACILHKPVSAEALIQAVENCLRRRGDRTSERSEAADNGRRKGAG